MPQFAQNPLNQFEREILPVGWPWRLFSIALAILAIVVLSYFGLKFGYQPYLNSKISETDAEFELLSQSIPQKDREAFISFYAQLVNLKNLLDSHITTSKIFPLLERMTNEKVYYTNANLKVPERELQLSATAESYAVLAEQLEAFDQAAEIERSTINQISQGSDNLVSLSVLLKLKNDAVK